VNEILLRTWLRAWALITVVDAIFATTLPVVAYGQPLGRVWQGVASVLIGPTAIQGGARTILLGLVIHATVALVWTTVFLVLVLLSPPLRRFFGTPAGILAAAAVYGPAIWIVMSLVVIPSIAHRQPQTGPRWWVQLFAHIPFVALPIVAAIGRGLGPAGRVADARLAGDAV
jgi:hypothetical protein